jgi:alanine dehydrogenase
MHLEAAELRCFLPCLMGVLDRAGAERIVVEEGYGAAMGVAPEDYTAASPKVVTGTRDDCFEQHVVVQVRCPPDEVLRRMLPDTVLVAMLHYPTRPGRVALLSELGVRCVSLDSVADDLGQRLVENTRGVGWYGVRAAFRELARVNRRFESPARGPLRATVLGAGAVAGHAVRACTRYGDEALHRRLVGHRVLGVEVTVLDFDTTADENYMRSRLERTDLLVDATARHDVTMPVVINEWVEALPQNAAILDLAADPYDFALVPPHVKGIEGVPHGTLDQYVFAPDDPAYDALDPRVDTTNRRLALSCYSWPGVEPLPCMEIYSRQVAPVLEMLLHLPMDAWDIENGHVIERAVARAELGRWRQRRQQ